MRGAPAGSQPPAGLPEARLRGRDRVALGVLLLLAGLSLAIGLHLFPRVFPEASIRFTLDRGASHARAAAWLRAQGGVPETWRHAERFHYDSLARIFLERELGLAPADSAFTGPLRLWRWQHRWFRPGEREEWRVALATTGELAACEHRLAEEAPGAALAPAVARARAERFLREEAAVALEDFVLVGQRRQERPQRRDHTFTWEYRPRQWAGASLRATVVVQGDRIGGFGWGLAVPEDWQRDYRALRSRNETAGLVATLLTGLLIVAIGVSFVRRVPRGTIAWRPALGFAGAAMILVMLAEANNLAGTLYTYDTGESLSAFAVARLVGLLMQGLGIGLLVFLLTAGGEPVYREAFPEKLTLGAFFTRRGLRTRRAFFGMLTGLALTAFFFAYQSVFYLLAGRWGAWAPADVPYDNLLNTSLPWAFVLLIGFSPAVVEEFSMRMFAVPALGRLLRSRTAGVLVAAAIWGFSHAGYPNEPFYIRAVEVGLAGVLVAVVMLRVNIFAALIWHYTVDALYAALLLLRSGEPYPLLTGALAAGLLLVPFAYALGAYLRTGRFLSPEGLRNRDRLPVGQPGRAPGPDEAVPTGARAMAPGSPPPARRWAWIGILTALGLAAGFGLAGEVWGPRPRYVLSASEARGRGEAFLAERGVALEGLRVAAAPRSRLTPLAYRYAATVLAPAPAGERLLSRVGPLAWVVRVFSPGQVEEWRVVVGADDGRPLGYEHRLAEGTAGDSLSGPAARQRAERFLEARGFDPGAWELELMRSEPRPARGDHTLRWKARRPAERWGEAALRQEVVVAGGEIASWRTFLQLPEQWLEQRMARGPWEAARIGLLVLLLFAGFAVAVLRILRHPPPGRVRWRMGLVVGGGVAVLSLLAGALGLSPRLVDYPTDQPWSLFLIEEGLVQVSAALVTGLLVAVALALLAALRPRFLEAVRRSPAAATRRDGWLGALCIAVWGWILARGPAVLGQLWPGASGAPDLSAPPGLGTALPLLAGLAVGVIQAILLLLLVGMISFLLGGGGRLRGVTYGLLGLATFALVPLEARGGAELAIGWLGNVALALTGLLLARHLLAGNPRAWLMSCLVLGIGEVALRYSGHPALRLDAGVLVLLLAAGVALLGWLPIAAGGVRVRRTTGLTPPPAPPS